MKKPPHRDHPSEPSRRSRRDRRPNGGSKGRWEFGVASESLFALFSSGTVRRAAYCTAEGEMRFLSF
jgi:ferric-dicitrate binding protein FerR (iron transport regulator)